MRQQIAIVNNMLKSNVVEVLKNACRALSSLMIPKKMVDCFLQIGNVQRLVELISNDDQDLVSPALGASINISAGTDEQTRSLVSCNILNILCKLMKQPSRKLRVDIMILISNVAACTCEEVGLIVESGILEEVSILFKRKDTALDLKKEAVWVFTNAVDKGLEHHREYFVETLEIVRPLCEMLKCHDQKIISLAIQCLFQTVEHYEKKKRGMCNTNGNEFSLETIVNIMNQSGAKLELQKQFNSSLSCEMYISHILKYL